MTFKAALMQSSGRGHRLAVQRKQLTLAAKAIGDLLCAAVFLTGSTRAEGCGLGVHRAATCKKMANAFGTLIPHSVPVLSYFTTFIRDKLA